jgi:hypothetical protein
MTEIKIQTPDVTPIVDILRSDGTAICKSREQTASRLRVTDITDVMADSDSNDQSTPPRSLFVPLRACSLPFNSQLPTTIRHYAQRLDALRRCVYKQILSSVPKNDVICLPAPLGGREACAVKYRVFSNLFLSEPP